MIESIYIILGIIIFLGSYVLYRIDHFVEEKKESTKVEKNERSQEQKTQETKVEESKPGPVYQLQTHKVKYWLYTPSYDFGTYGLRYLYHDIVIKNLWLNEPFHSKFYEILMVLDKNEFMIFDPNSKVITMNVRGEDNQLTTSKSFQVFATQDIIEVTLKVAMSDIVRFNKHDAQHILLAICFIALEQSLHYQSKEVSTNLIKSLLMDYKDAEDIDYVITLLKDQEEQLEFVNNAIQIAFQSNQTYAYNDSEVPKPLQLPAKLPQKTLKEV